MKILQEIKVPQESVNDEFVSIVDIFFKDGELIEKNDIIIELESSKAVFSVESEVAGYIKYFCKPEDEVAVNSVIIAIYDEMPTNFDKIIENNKEKETNIEISETLFSKEAEQYIIKNSVDKGKFTHLDFVNTNDILSILGINNQEKTTKISAPNTIQTEKIDKNKIILKDLTKNKNREIEYLKAVQKENINSTVNIYIDTKNIFSKINPHLKYFKNSLLPIIVFETARLLKKYPEFNAYFTNNQLAIFNEINVGFAIDMDFGLKTLKIPNTESKTIQEIEQVIFNLSNKYIDNKLQLSELTDITFTITDLSSEGVSFFVPLINKNNSAILGISANDDKLNRTILSLTFDHRVTAGKKATIFLRELKTRIESYNQTTDEEIDTSIKCSKCMKSLKEDFNDVGFLKVITKNGKEKYICQTCFSGF